MRIEPDQVLAVVVKLRQWGHDIPDADMADLVAEFDTRADLDENKVGKFSRRSLASRQAALRILPRTGTQRRRVYDYIRTMHGTHREQIAKSLGMSENSVRPRVQELIEGGWVRTAGYQTNARGQTVEILVANAQKEKS